MQPYQQLLHDFQQQSWAAKPFERMLALRSADNQQLLLLLKACVADCSKSATFIDAALSYLDEHQFAQLIADTMAWVKRGGWNDVRCSVIDYAALQLPQLLTPYLFELLTPRSNSYYDAWVWRKAGPAQIAQLVTLLGDELHKHHAWLALVNVRDAHALLLAQQHAATANPSPQIGAEVHALQQGFELNSQQARPLFVEAGYHLIVPDEYLAQLDAQYAGSVNQAALRKSNHPSWTLASKGEPQQTLGGTLEARHCGCCGGALHQLVTLPAQVLATDSEITLTSCLSCLGWEEEVLFYQHDAQGLPQALNPRDELLQPEFIAPALQQTSVYLVRTPARWLLQDWGLANGRENLNRILGAPSFIQSAQYPSCPHCQQLMMFCGQLDSGLLLEGGDEWLWGSGGICYLFWCGDCRISANFWQCT